MQDELRVRHEIRKALEPTVTPAPWLTARVRSSLRGRVKESQRPWPWKMARQARPAILAAGAIVLVIALVAALVLGSRILNPRRDVQVQPQVSKYRAMVNADFGAVEHLITTTTPCDAGHEAVCRQHTTDIKAAVQAYQDDLAHTTTPVGVSVYSAVLTATLADMMASVDAMLADLDRQDFAAYEKDGGRLFDTKLNVLYPFTVAVSCWPNAAVAGNDAAGYAKFVCAKTTPRDYLTILNRDWEFLRTSINSSNALCDSHGAQCRARTLDSHAIATQFKADVKNTQAPVEYTTFETELERALDALIARLNDRVTAIDAGDTARWDASNLAIEQVKFNVIARAIGEMACWPKGVHIGDDSSTTAWLCNST